MYVADLACGTGTLLTAAYQRIGWLFEAAGGEARMLHKPLIEHGLIGLDVLPAAVHLTATILSGVYPNEQYEQSQLYIARYGLGGNESRGVSIGSLELLDPNPQFEAFASLAQRVDARSAGAVAVDLGYETQNLDLCIMNPPYTRNTNHEGDRAADPFPAFAALGVARSQQRQMSTRLNRLVQRTMAHGNAGEASAFLALADKFTRPGGTIALVLPLTALMGESWSRARRALENGYHDIQIVTISGRATRALGFSADTNIAECLLVAQKDTKEALFDNRRASPRALMISLDQRPKDTVVSALLTEVLTELRASDSIRRLEDGPFGGTLIKIGDEVWGSVASIPINWGPGWTGARIADFSLAQWIYRLVEQGQVWLPGLPESSARPIRVTRFGDVAQLGPLHRDINGPSPRGSLDIRARLFNEVATYPVLWAHDAQRETTLV
ncbi:MAG: hypothetical protein C7B46_21010 [Sulfobacillus benefaciens]|uniref:Uncharacterized protein n=1 Tax=Sulfobacillus benefaciens TaxID=453960 RepID=A0A2T2WQP0_9FIRM|nr:MAG: hypothetical protein C7B46_21010 [Sulfobacillus benefaciens]